MCMQILKKNEHTVIYSFEMYSSKIASLQALIESYEGIGIVRTQEKSKFLSKESVPTKSIMNLITTPDCSSVCEAIIKEFINLKNNA